MGLCLLQTLLGLRGSAFGSLLAFWLREPRTDPHGEIWAPCSNCTVWQLLGTGGAGFHVTQAPALALWGTRKAHRKCKHKYLNCKHLTSPALGAARVIPPSLALQLGRNPPPVPLLGGGRGVCLLCCRASAPLPPTNPYGAISSSPLLPRDRPQLQSLDLDPDVNFPKVPGSSEPGLWFGSLQSQGWGWGLAVTCGSAFGSQLPESHSGVSGVQGSSSAHSSHKVHILVAISPKPKDFQL